MSEEDPSSEYQSIPEVEENRMNQILLRLILALGVIASLISAHDNFADIGK